MGAHIAVAKGEPGGLDPVGGQLLHHSPVLVLPAPTAYPIPAPAEGVHDRVEVRADPQTVKGDVVTSIGNHCEICRRIGAASPEHELGAADATGQDHDPHRTSLAACSPLAWRPGSSRVSMGRRLATLSVVILKGWT